jgi:hypothetical protein
VLRVNVVLVAPGEASTAFTVAYVDDSVPLGCRY